MIAKTGSLILTLVLLAAPLAAAAQEAKVYRIGYLSSANLSRPLSKGCASWATSRAGTSPSSSGTPRGGSIGSLASRPS